MTKRIPIQSPAGLAVIFPALLKPRAEAMRKALAAGLKRRMKLQPGQRFTVAGLKADPTQPGGFAIDCKPGEETVMVMGHDDFTPLSID